MRVTEVLIFYLIVEKVLFYRLLGNVVGKYVVGSDIPKFKRKIRYGEFGNVYFMVDLPVWLYRIIFWTREKESYCSFLSLFFTVLHYVLLCYVCGCYFCGMELNVKKILYLDFGILIIYAFLLFTEQIIYYARHKK